jgi:hypothetical protein
MPRKRRHEEMAAAPEPAAPTSQQASNGSGSGGLLSQLRNMWEFANLMQYIYTFGKVVKIDDDLDIEVYNIILLAPMHL